MAESDIRTFTYNHGAPVALASSLTTLGRLRADGIAPPYDCDLSPAENGLMLTVAGAQGGIRAAHLPLGLLKPIMEKRAELNAEAKNNVRFGVGREPNKAVDTHFVESTNSIMDFLDGHGIHIPHAEGQSRNTAEWMTRTIYSAMESVMARTNQNAPSGQALV